MGSSTGIEFGPDSCVLAGVRRPRAGGADILALHTIEPAEWPSHDTALAETLRNVRRSKRFPRRARVIAWGLPEDATNDAISRAGMRPLVDAGFIVESIVTPPQALAILASTRARPAALNTAVAWLALNMHGAAIAIVRGTELLFARTFQWTYNPHLLEARAQLLQRYSLIAHLAPEVRRGIAAVRASYGVSVDAAVTCGDLPELRSLTMPLIEELDLEVETLDSLEGLRPVGKAKLERLVEAAPAIRLACAAALAPVQRRTSPFIPVLRIAAAVALVAAIVFAGYRYWSRWSRPAIPASHAVQAASPRPASRPSARMPRGSQPLNPIPKGEPKVARPTESRSAPALMASAPGGRPSSRPADFAVAAAQRRSVSSAKTTSAVRRVPTKAPLPKVDSILIDQQRRLAIIEGAVAGIGDVVGGRVIVQIDRDAVVLQEPSGLLVRVLLRSPLASSISVTVCRSMTYTCHTAATLRMGEIVRRIHYPVTRDPHRA